MIKQLLNLMILLIIISVFGGCSKIANVPDIAQPIIFSYSDKSSVLIGTDTIKTGPLKDYEQGSDVVYRFTVSSKLPLTKLTVTTTSDIFSSASKVLKTIPANAIDSLGNFTQSLTSVIIYYAYRIDPLIAPLSNVTTTFTFQNQGKYVGIINNSFTVIKKGSTSGKLLSVISMSGANFTRPYGIGVQDNLDIVSGSRATADVAYRKGPLYSLSLRTDFLLSSDALLNESKIDLVGYRTKYTGVAPTALTNAAFYLVSPSDTVMLTSGYAGAIATTINLFGTSGTANITVAGVSKTATYVTSTTVAATNFVTANAAAYSAAGLTLTSNAAALIFTIKAPSLSPNPVFGRGTIVNVTGDLGGSEARDAKNDLLRATIRQMASDLKAVGKTLNKIYFQRLDNLPAGPTQVTTAYFDQLTHDNEFDILLQNVKTGGKTNIGPINLNEVYGFVMEDGRRGLIRTSPVIAQGTVINNAGLTNTTVPAPNTGDWVLYCTIKFQDK